MKLEQPSFLKEETAPAVAPSQQPNSLSKPSFAKVSLLYSQKPFGKPFGKMKASVKPAGLFDENGERDKAAKAPSPFKNESNVQKKEEEEIPFSEQFGIKKDHEPISRPARQVEEASDPFSRFDEQDPLAKYASRNSP